jgi:protein-S-isoprenylcysteine O-methyltransferase Ste14
MSVLELKLVQVLLVAGGMWALSRQAPAFAAPDVIRHGLAAILVLAGTTISVAGKLQFSRKGTTVNPMAPERASALVTVGIYRYTRNPMYVGFLLVLLGWAAWLANPSTLIGPAIFVLYMNRFQIAPEERVLGKLFGSAYADYTARVRRWI